MAELHVNDETAHWNVCNTLKRWCLFVNLTQ